MFCFFFFYIDYQGMNLVCLFLPLAKKALSKETLFSGLKKKVGLPFWKCQCACVYKRMYKSRESLRNVKHTDFFTGELSNGSLFVSVIIASFEMLGSFTMVYAWQGVMRNLNLKITTLTIFCLFFFLNILWLRWRKMSLVLLSVCVQREALNSTDKIYKTKCIY